MKEKNQIQRMIKEAKDSGNLPAQRYLEHALTLVEFYENDPEKPQKILEQAIKNKEVRCQKHDQ
jgi:hypothetical protein